MKRIITYIVASFVLIPLVNAQNPNKIKDFSDIWKEKKYLKVSYDIAQTQIEGSSVEDGKWGFGLTTGRTWLFPKAPVANIFKFGFDVNWLDFHIAKYSSANSGFNMPEGWNDYEDEDNFLSTLSNMGRMSLNIGIIGLGPNISFAPFSNSWGPQKYFKGSLYFHYQPTFGVYMVSEDGDMDAAYAYCNMFQFGGQISWKFIGIGIEGYWGSGKFKPIMAEFGGDILEGDIRDELGLPAFNNKFTRKFATTRLFVSFNF